MEKRQLTIEVRVMSGDANLCSSSCEYNDSFTYCQLFSTSIEEGRAEECKKADKGLVCEHEFVSTEQKIRTGNASFYVVRCRKCGEEPGAYLLTSKGRTE